MKATHTKGEWITSEGQIYPQETGKTLALIPYFDKDNEEQQANAKLIAAAPEMLEALEYIIENIEKLPNKGIMGKTITESQCLNKAKAALQSAKD